MKVQHQIAAVLRSEENLKGCGASSTLSKIACSLQQKQRGTSYTQSTALGAELGQNYPPLLSPTYFRAAAHGTVHQIIYSLSDGTSLHRDSLPMLTHH